MPDHCDNLRDDVPECLKRSHKEVMPGIYECSEGHQHINGPEVCEALGVEPTRENLAMLLESLKRQIKDLKVIP